MKLHKVFWISFIGGLVFWLLLFWCCTRSHADTVPQITAGSNTPAVTVSTVATPLVGAPLSTSQLTITDPTGRPTCRIDSGGMMWFDSTGRAWANLSYNDGYPCLILMQGTASVMVSLTPSGAVIRLDNGDGSSWTYSPPTVKSGGAKGAGVK